MMTSKTFYSILNISNNFIDNKIWFGVILLGKCSMTTVEMEQERERGFPSRKSSDLVNHKNFHFFFFCLCFRQLSCDTMRKSFHTSSRIVCGKRHRERLWCRSEASKIHPNKSGLYVKRVENVSKIFIVSLENPFKLPFDVRVDFGFSGFCHIPFLCELEPSRAFGAFIYSERMLYVALLTRYPPKNMNTSRQAPQRKHERRTRFYGSEGFLGENVDWRRRQREEWNWDEREEKLKNFFPDAKTFSHRTGYK